MIDPIDLIVEANVDETDLDQVWLKQKVDITLEGYPDALLTGFVHEIAQDATTVNNVTTYQVNVFLDQTPPFVKSGLSADLFFRISDRPSVLRVPTDALTPEGQVLVVEAPDTAPVLRDIKIGATDGTFTEILSGLHEGDWIAIPKFELQRQNNNGFSFMPAHTHPSHH